MLAWFVLILSLFISTESFQSPGIYQIVTPIDHAESPTWEGRKALLYFVNIHAGEVYSYDYQTEELWSIKLDGEVAPVVPSRNNTNLLIIGLNRSVVAIDWDGKSNDLNGWSTITELIQQSPSSRVNEGKADKDGRFWIGTMGYEGPDGLTPDDGILYKITNNNIQNALPMIAPVNISNGLAWNQANDKMFYIDTISGKVVEYAYNSLDGSLAFSRDVFNMADHPELTGGPDGMTIDEEDNLWVALYGGGSVIKIDSNTGELLDIIAIPALYVTSAVWGGPELDILFVTTSRYSLTEQQKKEQPAAGSVFAVVGLGVKGLPMYEADLINSLDDIPRIKNDN